MCEIKLKVEIMKKELLLRRCVTVDSGTVNKSQSKI